jgi:hypothetical protein
MGREAGEAREARKAEGGRRQRIKEQGRLGTLGNPEKMKVKS